MSDKLFKSEGVFWIEVEGSRGQAFIADTPLCAVVGCHAPLVIHSDHYYCDACGKKYARSGDHSTVVNLVRRKWEGYQTRDFKVISLDLPPTKVVDEDNQDDHYWVQARISEKDGKRMAVVYFGEKTHGKQNKDDYAQVFIDFDDEQMRFDKTNKNPMKILGKLTADFKESSTVMKVRDNK